MKLNQLRVALLSAVSMSALLMAHDIYAAPASKAKKGPVKLAAAALAARLDTDPAVNGAIGDWKPLPSDTILQAAAEAARRDHDPMLNGSASSENAVAPNTAEMETTAAAARAAQRDTNPDVNGSAIYIIWPQAEAERHTVFRDQ